MATATLIVMVEVLAELKLRNRVSNCRMDYDEKGGFLPAAHRDNEIADVES